MLVDPSRRRLEVLKTDQDCDPYLWLKLPELGQDQTIRHRNRTRNPDWMEAVTFSGVSPGSGLLEVLCMDHDSFTKDDLIGVVTYPLSLLTAGVKKEVWLNLECSREGQHAHHASSSSSSSSSSSDEEEKDPEAALAGAGRVHLALLLEVRVPRDVPVPCAHAALAGC